MVKQLERAFATTAFILVMGLYSGMAGAHGKVSLKQDTCVRGTQGSMVHLSMYQPQNEPSAQYCTEIPTEDETVSLLRADYHPDGVIRGRTNLDKGFYTVFITGESVPPVRYQYLLRVQQINYARVARSSMGPLIALLLLTLLGCKLVKSKVCKTG